MFGADNSQPSESLQAALLGLARNQLIALLVLWLIFYAPVACQYHGLLLNTPDIMQKQEVHPHSLPYADAALNLLETTHTSPLGAPSIKPNHSTAAATLFLMSLMTVLTPDSALNNKLDAVFMIHIVESVPPQQPEHLPPEQPPRLIGHASLDLYNGHYFVLLNQS